MCGGFGWLERWRRWRWGALAGEPQVAPRGRERGRGGGRLCHSSGRTCRGMGRMPCAGGLRGWPAAVNSVPMGFLHRLFGGSAAKRSAEGEGERSPTEVALLALAKKEEAAFLQGMALGLPIDVNDMQAGAPMLSLAIGKGLDRAAVAILERGPDLSLVDEHVGMTALAAAISRQNAEMVRRLIAAGSDVNATFGPAGSARRACLSAAVKGGDLGIVRMLLEAGAKPDCDLQPDAAEEEDRGLTPLTFAASTGNLELMRLMIDHGANVNHWPKSTISPLMHACFNGQVEAAKLLVEKGALIELASVKLNTHAFEVALKRGHKELAGWLWERSKILQSGYEREVWAS